MSQIDTVRQLVLDKSAADMSGAANYAAAIADTAAQCTRLDCEVAEQVDVTVKITNLGSGPATKILVVGRCSSAADPDVTTAADWAPINTEAVDTATGISTVVMYQLELAVSAVGEYQFTLPVRQRWMAPVVWLDSASGSRGQVFMYRRR